MSDKQIAVKAPVDVAVQAAQAVKWLATIEQKIEDSDDPEEVSKYAAQIELTKAAAQKTRMQEIIAKASIASLKSYRKLGNLLGESAGVGRPSKMSRSGHFDYAKYGFSRQDISKIRKVGEMPDYVFDYALKNAVVPTLNQVLREYDRYSTLKSVSERADVKSVEATLKEFVSKGYTPLQAEQELNPKEEDDEDGFVTFTDEDEEDDDFDVEGIEIELDEFEANAKGMEMVVEKMKDTFSTIDSISEKDFDRATKALKRIRLSVRMLTELFKDASGLVEKGDSND